MTVDPTIDKNKSKKTDKYLLSQGDNKSAIYLPKQNLTNISCQRGIKSHLKVLIYIPAPTVQGQGLCATLKKLPNKDLLHYL